MATAIIEATQSEAHLPVDGPDEIIDGKPVEKRMGAYEVHLTNLIDFFLGRFAFDRQLGLVESLMLFHFGQDGQPQRRPGVAYISEARWPRGRKIPSEDAWAVIPDLVVAVVSPTNSASEVEGKVVEYLTDGVRLVWVVHPTTARVYIHDGSANVRVVSRDQELDGGVVLPDFRLPMVDLFGA